MFNIIIISVIAHLLSHVLTVAFWGIEYHRLFGTIWSIWHNHTQFGEDKFILSQSACFVTENVTYIGELFVKIHVVDSKLVDLFVLFIYIAHLHVALHKLRRYHFGYLEDYWQL